MRLKSIQVGDGDCEHRPLKHWELRVLTERIQLRCSIHIIGIHKWCVITCSFFKIAGFAEVSNRFGSRLLVDEVLLQIKVLAEATNYRVHVLTVQIHVVTWTPLDLRPVLVVRLRSCRAEPLVVSLMGGSGVWLRTNIFKRLTSKRSCNAFIEAGTNFLRWNIQIDAGAIQTDTDLLTGPLLKRSLARWRI